MPGRLEFDLGFGRTARRRDDEQPMRLLVLGDFSGRPAAERPPLAARPTLQVDIDTFDPVMRKLAPRLTLPSGQIAFAQMDDFHPDRLYARLDLFQTLRAERGRVPADDEDLVARLLGKPPEGDAPPSQQPRGLDALIHKVVAPHIVKDPSAAARAYESAWNAALAGQMRALLHDTAFQSFEATWRGLHWLVSGLELDEHLQLHLLDVTRDEILADIVAAQGKLAETGLYRALVDRWRNVPGGQGWSAIATSIAFGPSDADVGLLAALGLIASQAGGPLLGGADWALAGEDERQLAAWHALRRSEAATWIGLAAPRVLLRLPFGSRSDPLETIPFEEFTGAPDQGALLWGNPALALTLLLGRAFSARGWDMEPGDEREIGDMPAYTYLSDGEPVMQPCGERVLTESLSQKLLEAGLIPIASRRDRNAIVAIRVQSIADPPAPLAW